MPSATAEVAARICPGTVRHQLTGMDEPCGTRLPKGQPNCPRYGQHVHQYKTGYCGGKQCEGTKPKSPTGRPMKVCTFWLTCPCSCHTELSEMFFEMGRERRLGDNPDYVPQVTQYKMPTHEELMAIKEANRPKEQRGVLVKSDSTRAPDAMVREFAPTETGRAARGQLEQNVQQACSAWIKGDREEECTTAWVADWIDNELGIPGTSRGAINACWGRWEQIGFALVGDHPIRFLTYTPEGRKLGLEELKDRAKRQRQRQVNDQKLGRR